MKKLKTKVFQIALASDFRKLDRDHDFKRTTV